jgi:hexosaminidase
MKKLFSLALALSVGAAVFAQEKKDATLNIVPLPQQVQIKNGTFKINANTKIAFDSEEDKKVAMLFQDFLKSNYNLNLSVVKSASSNTIYFSSKNAKSTNAEAYELNISSDRATISGKAAGLFYGMQSLIQLLPVDKKASIEIQQASIQDEPRFAYRGLHLDVGRHFFPV